MATFFVYLVFVLLKFNTVDLFADDAFETPVDLVDWNDDRFCQDKEFTAEVIVFKSVIVTISTASSGDNLKTDFFYNKIYKEIKLNIITPPPRLG